MFLAMVAPSPGAALHMRLAAEVSSYLLDVPLDVLLDVLLDVPLDVLLDVLLDMLPGPQDFELPGIGSVGGFSGSRKSSEFFFSFTSKWLFWCLHYTQAPATPSEAAASKATSSAISCCK
jgi:hypothetical protein